MNCIRVLVADDHPITQEGIYTVLKKTSAIQPIGRATNGQEALTLANKYRPDILLLSLHLPGLPPAELVVLLRQQSPQTKMVVFNSIGDKVQVRELAELGLAGYILKDEKPEMLIHALRTVSLGNTWFSQPIAAMFIHQTTGETGPHGLTTKERTILRLAVIEKTDKEIALALNLSERTVRKHLRVIYDKLEVDSRAGAAYEAGRLRLFDE